jgi:hypothetical protein
MIPLGRPSFLDETDPPALAPRTLARVSRHAPPAPPTATEIHPPIQRGWPRALRQWASIGEQQVDERMLHWMFHAFQMYVAYVSSGCFKVYLLLPMLQWLYMYVASVFSNVLAVSNVCCTCFIWMLYMLQWLYTYVVSVHFKYFSCFKCMLQVFYLDIVYVALAIHICCNCMFQLFQMYVGSVLSRCYICCSDHTHMLQAYVCKCFICFERML